MTLTFRMSNDQIWMGLLIESPYVTCFLMEIVMFLDIFASANVHDLDIDLLNVPKVKARNFFVIFDSDNNIDHISYHFRDICMPIKIYIYNFLFHFNSNVSPIYHHFRYIKSKYAWPWPLEWTRSNVNIQIEILAHTCLHFGWQQKY